MEYKEQDLGHVAQTLVSSSGDQKVWCFHGEMGAGKTTLIKAICTELGVEDDMSSPTFSIVNEYRKSDGSPIYHFDFYRIREMAEAIDIGAEEYFYSGNYCFIEWPGIVDGLLPPDRLEININLVDQLTRSISLTSA